MRNIMVPILATAFFLILAVYAYQAVRTASQDLNSPWRQLVRIGFWAIEAALIGWFWVVMVQLKPNSHSSFWMPWVGFMILLIVPQMVTIMFLIGEDFYRLGRSLVLWVSKIFTHEPIEIDLSSRRKFLSQVALGAAAIPFLNILYGITWGKYNYTVRKETLAFDDLPEAFDGFKIVQISDVHSGSFDNITKVEYGIDLINEQKGDVIVFTGDLVNNTADEIEPYLDVFSKLQAPMGKFSILGNHDYGDYIEWGSEDAKIQNLDALKEHHRAMGFNLLLNQSVELKKGEEEISLAGVENWGKPPFVQYGDLNKALKDTQDFRVLLSHDPSHYDEQVVEHPKKVHLTLSGHTHGMQFGIEIPGFKWSPVKYKYPKWAGLYEKAGQYLYVNRGFGFLAFPGRVGIWPEITVIELKKA